MREEEGRIPGELGEEGPCVVEVAVEPGGGARADRQGIVIPSSGTGRDTPPTADTPSPHADSSP